MSEVYLEMDLRLPDENSSAIVQVLDRANPNLSLLNLVSEFSIFGEVAESLLKEAIRKTPDWVDEAVDIADQLQPQGFNYEGRLAKVQFIGSDLEALAGLESFLTKVFISGGVEVVNTEIYSEEDLDDYENDDENNEFAHLEF